MRGRMPAITKSQQVEGHFRKSILKGVLAPGQKLPPEREILQRFRVSRTTVRDALNALASDGLVRRKQGHGTFVSDQARQGIVATVFNTMMLSSPVGFYFRRLLDEAKKHIQRAGYRPFLAAAYGETPMSDDVTLSTSLLDGRITGQVLGVLSMAALDEIEDRLADAGIAAVSVRGTPVEPSQYSVILDNVRRIELAVELLRSRGHDDFAVMYSQAGPRPTVPENDYTFQVIDSTLRACGVEPSDGRVIGVPWSGDCAHAYDVFKQWWARPDRPRAIFFYEDAVCDVATRAILELGIKVPQELAIVTHANVGRTFHFPVSLTRVEYDPAEVVAIAWNMLAKLIGKEPVDEPRVFVPPNVREGESLG